MNKLKDKIKELAVELKEEFIDEPQTVGAEGEHLVEIDEETFTVKITAWWESSRFVEFSAKGDKGTDLSGNMEF
jgi:hypothetical protein